MPHHGTCDDCGADYSHNLSVRLMDVSDVHMCAGCLTRKPCGCKSDRWCGDCKRVGFECPGCLDTKTMSVKDFDGRERLAVCNDCHRHDVRHRGTCDDCGADYSHNLSVPLMDGSDVHMCAGCLTRKPRGCKSDRWCGDCKRVGFECPGCLDTKTMSVKDINGRERLAMCNDCHRSNVEARPSPTTN